MSLKLSIHTRKDPDGHNPHLRLQGNWLEVHLSDGTHTGVGEASHSGDDTACAERVRQLCDVYLKHFTPSMKKIQYLENTVFREIKDFITATAISAINQALYDLLAKEEGVPVWQLFNEEPIQSRVPFYTTINRVLKTRTLGEYLQVCKMAVEGSLTHIKCAPFETVLPEMSKKDQLDAVRMGIKILDSIKENFPTLELRVDFHNRFHKDVFLGLIGHFESLKLEWIEEPCVAVSDFMEIRETTEIPLAAGELFFGPDEFIRLMDAELVDVIMPDIKHIGGLGPLITVCREAEAHSIAVSPHNPSGPTASRLTLHAAGVSDAVTSIETALLSTGEITIPKDFRHGNLAAVPGI